jgi:hypothetical protein
MHMTIRVIFNAEKKIKDLAMKAAKKQGVSLSYFLNQALLEVAQGEKRVEIVETLNKKTQQEVKQAMLDFKKGKNISPAFTSVEEGFAWLDAK